jgi:predicted dehydrogenase
MIRLALIGCGEHSEGGHAVPLARYRKEHPDEVELTAACDLRSDRAELFRARYGFLRSYDDMNKMLEHEKVDACIAVVPVEKIPQVGINLLERRMPCVVEKPLGASLADIELLRRAARDTGTANMVSVNRRFMPFLNRALEWSRQQGQFRYVRCAFTRHARTEPQFLSETGVHAMDTMRYIAGDIKSATIRVLQPAKGAADWYTIDLEFESGVCGQIDVLPTCGLREETYEIFGEDFRASVTCPFGPQRGFRCFRESRVVLEDFESAATTEDVVNGFYDEAAALIHAPRTKERLHPSIEEVFPSVRLCLELASQAASMHSVSARS